MTPSLLQTQLRRRRRGPVAGAKNLRKGQLARRLPPDVSCGRCSPSREHLMIKWSLLRDGGWTVSFKRPCPLMAMRTLSMSALRGKTDMAIPSSCLALVRDRRTPWRIAPRSVRLASKAVSRCRHHSFGRPLYWPRAPVAVVSMTSKSWVIVAVLAIIADAEQYFSTDSAMARSTLSGASRRPFTTKCM